MFTLDPVKILIIGIVAMLVLGPDKLPAAARKVASLVGDLQRLRASLHEQIQETVGDHPLVTELTGARDGLLRLREAADPRQALYRSIGLSAGDVRPGATLTATGVATEVPGSIDLAVVPEPARAPSGEPISDPSQN